MGVVGDTLSIDRSTSTTVAVVTLFHAGMRLFGFDGILIGWNFDFD